MKTILGILCLLLISCNDIETYRHDIDQIKIGQKRSHVLKTLGDPCYTTVDADGNYRSVYRFEDTTISRRNIYSVVFYFKQDTLNAKIFR